MNNKIEDVVTYKLINADLTARTGTLEVTFNGRRFKDCHVELSGQLIWLIKQQGTTPNMRQYTNKMYSSTMGSPSFNANPFKLQRYNNPDGTFKNYYLKLVTDKGYYMKTSYNKARQLITKAVYMHWSTSQFIRFQLIDLK